MDTSNNLSPLLRAARFLVMCVSRLPMSVLYVFADLTYFIMYRVIRYRIKVVRSNLRLAFPSRTDSQLHATEKAFYHHLADYFFETIKGLTIGDEELLRRYVIRNPEVLRQLTEQGKNVFLYGAHIGNWEWLTSLPLYYPDIQIQTFYQPQRHAFSNAMTLQQRTRRGIVAVESQKGFRFMYKYVSSGAVSITLILGDQCPHYAAQKYWVDFMGQDTPFLVGPEHIARKLNIALVYPSYVAYSRGHYEVEMRVIEPNPKECPEQECTARFADFLADDLERLPELWLWSHRRWKLKHEDESKS